VDGGRFLLLNRDDSLITEKPGKEGNMKVSEAIQTKRAVRKFQEMPIPKEAIEKILHAGRRAQSAKNQQPWHFIVIQDRSRLKALAAMGQFASHLSGAAMGVAIITPPPSQRFSIMFDAGQAAAFMQLAAWEMGIGSCPATIYEPEEARKLLGFPEEMEIRIALSFGYPLDESVISAPPKKGGRKSADEIIHWEEW
jgi:nitroreductase